MSTTDSTGTFSSGILIGDVVSGVTPTPTLVNGVSISSCLELQSTTTALTLPRMTNAQIKAISTTVDGMTAYATDIKAPAVKMAGQWQYPLGMASVTLTAAQVDSLKATPVTLLPALPAGSGYVVYMATAFLTPTLSVFVSADGVIDIYFDGPAKESALSNTFENPFIVSADGGRITSLGVNGNGTAIDPTETNGFALKIRNPNIEFTGGGTATITITVWYSIIID